MPLSSESISRRHHFTPWAGNHSARSTGPDANVHTAKNFLSSKVFLTTRNDGVYFVAIPCCLTANSGGTFKMKRAKLLLSIPLLFATLLLLWAVATPADNDPLGEYPLITTITT